MYEKVSERSGGEFICSLHTHVVRFYICRTLIALDDRIDDIAELVQKHYGVPDLGDPSAETEVRPLLLAHSGF